MTSNEAFDLLEELREDYAGGANDDNGYYPPDPEVDGSGADDLLADDLVLGSLHGIRRGRSKRRRSTVAPEYIAADEALDELCRGFGEKYPPFGLLGLCGPQTGKAIRRLMLATIARTGRFTRHMWLMATEAQREDARWLALKLDELDERRAIQEAG